MKHQAYQMAMLFDFYGELLTERQKEFFDLYYNEDLSLAEIAENSGITRQGVRDVIVRAEAILTEMEEKTGMIARFQILKDCAAQIEAAVEELSTINNRRFHDRRVAELTDEIARAAQKIKE